MFAMLKEKRVDLIFVDGLPGYEMLKSEGGEEFEAIGDPVDSGGAMSWACIAVSKKQPQLRNDLNAAIQTLLRTGEYGRINRRYFDFTIY